MALLQRPNILHYCVDKSDPLCQTLVIASHPAIVGIYIDFVDQFTIFGLFSLLASNLKD